MSAWLISELAGAALHSDRANDARARFAIAEATVGDTPASWITLALRHARAVLATDHEEAARRFDETLSTDLDCWSFQRAHLLLAQSQWLRR